MSGEDFFFDAAIAKAARNEHLSAARRRPTRWRVLVHPNLPQDGWLQSSDDELLSTAIAVCCRLLMTER